MTASPLCRFVTHVPFRYNAASSFANSGFSFENT